MSQPPVAVIIPLWLFAGAQFEGTDILHGATREWLALVGWLNRIGGGRYWLLIGRSWFPAQREG